MRYSEYFTKGFAKVFDIFGLNRKFVEVDDGRRQDYDSLKEDWSRIGQDIQAGIDRYEKERNTFA